MSIFFMRAYISICVFLLVCLAPCMCRSEDADPLRRWDLAYRSADAELPDYARALGELQRGIILGVGDCDLYYRMGYCYEKLGKAEMAERAFRLALSSGHDCPSDILYYIHLHTGVHAFEKGDKGDMEGARDHFRKAVEIRPERRAARNNLAVLERELGGGGGGADSLPGLEDRDPILRNNRAIILGEEGRMEEALAEYDNARSAGREETFLSYGRAEILNSSGRHGEAEEAYLACDGKEPGDPMPRFRLAEIALLDGEHCRFIESYQMALDIDPGAHIPPAISASTGASRSLLSEARGDSVAMDPGELERDLAARRDALSRNDADARTHCELGRLCEYNGAGEWYGDGFPMGRAVEHYSRALSLDPDCAEARLGLGSLFHLAGDEEGALEEYEAALDADGSLSAAHFNRALILSSRGRYDRAVRSLKEAVRSGPDLPQAHYRLALALTGEGSYGEAIDEYEKTLALLPGIPECYFNMGRIYADHMGERKKAVECYEKYLRARPCAPDREEVLRLIGALEERER